jgi:hypothetical protein
MSIFEDKYLFIHDGKRSKDYISLILATRAGAAKVKAVSEDVFYRTFIVGQNEGTPRDYFGAVTRARQLLRVRPVGETIAIARVRASTDQTLEVVKFRHTLRQPPVADTRGSISLDRVEGYVRVEFPKARFAGDCVCKPDSDHAFCAAVDYFDTEANMVAMRTAFLQNADYFGTMYVILFDRIYFPTGNGTFRSEAYHGDFHSHVHVSVAPRGENAC